MAIKLNDIAVIRTSIIALSGCFRRIVPIVKMPVTTIFSWIRKAGKIAGEAVKKQE